MRELKFRAWDVIARRMLKWGNIFHLPAWEIFPGTPEQRPYEVMQFTGLKDKNGKEIYEGDIVKAWIDIGPGGCTHHTYSVEITPFGPNLEAWTFEESEYLPEVIGNIHANPELLEAKA